jgi:hypothetical protein
MRLGLFHHLLFIIPNNQHIFWACHYVSKQSGPGKFFL